MPSGGVRQWQTTPAAPAGRHLSHAYPPGLQTRRAARPQQLHAQLSAGPALVACPHRASPAPATQAAAASPNAPGSSPPPLRAVQAALLQP